MTTVKLPQKGHPRKGQGGSPGFCASAKSNSKPAREAAPPPRARAAEETRGRRIPEPRHPDLTNPAPAIPRTHHRRPGSTPRTCARRPQAYTAEALPLPAPVTGVGAWPSAVPPCPTRERSPGQVFTLRIRALGTAQPGHAPSVSGLGSSSEGQAHSSLRGASPAWLTSPPWELLTPGPLPTLCWVTAGPCLCAALFGLLLTATHVCSPLVLLGPQFPDLSLHAQMAWGPSCLTRNWNAGLLGSGLEVTMQERGLDLSGEGQGALWV